MADGANVAATAADRFTGATVLFWTSSPSQSWAPTMTSGPLPTLVASLNCWRTSVATLMPFSWPNWSAYFCRIGARSLSAQMTRSALASRTGGAVVVGDGAGAVVVEVDDVLVLSAAGVLDPPQALISRAATPVMAAAPNARLCMNSPCNGMGQAVPTLKVCKT